MEGTCAPGLPVHYWCDPPAGRPQACAAAAGRVLKTHESTRKLARRVEQGTARILNATLSTGTAIANPRALERSLRKLRWLNRELHRRRPQSRRHHQTCRRLARVHAPAANLRRDALHKLTTTLRRNARDATRVLPLLGITSP
jgi:Probable transposase